MWSCNDRIAAQNCEADLDRISCRSRSSIRLHIRTTPHPVSSTPVHLGDNTHERRAEHHSDNTKTSLRNRLIDHSGARTSARRTSARRGTGRSSLGGSRSSGRGRVTALVAEDGVCAALLLKTFGQLVDGLLLGQTVDAAVVLVLDGRVALAARVEGAGDVAGDWGTAGCVGDVGEDVDVAGAVRDGGHFGVVRVQQRWRA